MACEQNIYDATNKARQPFFGLYENELGLPLSNKCLG